MPSSRRSPSKPVPLVPGTIITHTDLVRSVCKITSYLHVEKRKEAKEWADTLRQQLKELGL